MTTSWSRSLTDRLPVAGLVVALLPAAVAQITSLPFDLVDVAADPQAPDFCGVDFTWVNADAVYGNDSAGASVVDFDNDGLLDIFLPNSQQASSKLYRNLGNLQFVDVARERGVDDPASASSQGLFIDYDHDGDLDLFVAGHLGKPTNPLGPRFKLFRNQGPAGAYVFSDVTASAGFALSATPKQTLWGWVSGNSAGDYDQDGWTDIFFSWNGFQISGNDQWRLMRNAPNPAPGDPLDPSYTPRVFEDKTLSSWMLGEYGGEPWQTRFWDVNRDGWPDLHIPQDNSIDLMMLNNKNGTFSDVATAVGLNGDPPEFRNEMGTALGDFDLDLDLDLHATNVSFDDRFYRNDSLKTSLGFTDIAMATGLNNSIWGWGTAFFDVDNDGDLDHASVCDTINHIGAPDRNTFHLNLYPEQLADGLNVKWADVGALLPEFVINPVPTGDSGRGLVPVDLDGDGDLDLVVTRNEARAQVFRNTLVSGNEWLQVGLAQADGNLDTTGARVYLRHAGRTLLRQLDTGSSFLCQEPPRLHFGLGPPVPHQLVGPATGAPSGAATGAAAASGPAGTAAGGFQAKPASSRNPPWLVVRWPDGAAQIVLQPKRNTLHAIVRSSVDDTGDLNADGQLTATDQAMLLLATQDLVVFESTYPKSPGRITGDVNDDGVVDVDDLAAWSLLPPH